MHHASKAFAPILCELKYLIISLTPRKLKKVSLQIAQNVIPY